MKTGANTQGAAPAILARSIMIPFAIVTICHRMRETVPGLELCMGRTGEY